MTLQLRRPHHLEALASAATTVLQIRPRQPAAFAAPVDLRAALEEQRADNARLQEELVTAQEQLQHAMAALGRAQGALDYHRAQSRKPLREHTDLRYFRALAAGAPPTCALPTLAVMTTDVISGTVTQTLPEVRA